MAHSIDELMMDLNAIANLPNVEVLRRPCIRYTRTVYNKVDPSGEKVCMPDYLKLIPKDGIINIPPGVRSIVDVYEGTIDRSYLGMHEIPNRRINFKRDRLGESIMLIGKYAGTVTVATTKYPTDEEGNLLIIEPMYEATLAYSKASFLKDNLSMKLQWRDTMTPYRIHDMDAERLIAACRAELHTMSRSDFRELNTMQRGARY